MPTKQEMVAAGYFNQEALAAAGTFQYNVTATVGGTQATSTKITACNAVITTSTASGTDSVVIPAGSLGDWIQIFNYSANTIKVWPPIGWAFHGGAQNAGISIPAGKSAAFTQTTDPTLGALPPGMTYQQYAVSVSA